MVIIIIIKAWDCSVCVCVCVRARVRECVRVEHEGKFCDVLGSLVNCVKEETIGDRTVGATKTERRILL
jgi:hypothetical protein